MAVIATAHTDPDAIEAQEGFDRAVVVLTDKTNEIGSSVLQVRFLKSVVDFILGVNPADVASGAASLAATTPVSTPVAALGGSSGTSTPPAGVVDLHKVGVDFAAMVAEAGWADPSVALAWFRDLVNEVRVAELTGNKPNAERLRKGLSKFAHDTAASDLEDSGAHKVHAALATAKSELATANTAKTAAETSLATVTRERDALQAKLATAKGKWDAFRVKLNGTDVQEGGKFKKNAPVPTTEAAELTTALN